MGVILRCRPLSGAYNRPNLYRFYAIDCISAYGVHICLSVHKAIYTERFKLCQHLF